ncbi:FumA C-terminus/TtdB family hydratase beta subunit [Micromonospora olivasterospora]|uniref:Fumarate hydratase class I n=1 Tax=Micromonospora olivasterospora TaxID=1880 RepID=A0A562IJR9_MICOL|nr:FumA C-terminus/TtdB family hydratase beta subunit [Micromonospora olivasterospora]TWH70975.1 homodimeric fumarase (class I) [Micromonospora olivasterospora]
MATEPGPLATRPDYDDPDFDYTPILPRGKDTVEFVAIDAPPPEVVDRCGDTLLKVSDLTLARLADVAFTRVSHQLRTSHLEQLRNILDDPEASANDKYVATDLLRNAAISAQGILPMCQDTGTAIVFGQRGSRVLTDGRDARHLSRGIHHAYKTLNLRYSQLAPLTTYREVNTGNNLPAQIEILAEGHDTYEFLFMAKGGGSANKSFLFQETRALLDEQRLLSFLTERISALGTAACPPYHLAVVIGGTSAEYALKTAKLASARYLDTLPTSGSPSGHGFRDLHLEEQILSITRQLGIGAQFGGKYFCHDVRVVRLPRHGGSCPVAIAVSCSADRQILGRITAEGVFLEKLEEDPSRFLPEVTDAHLVGEVVAVDVSAPMTQIRAKLSGLAVGTRLSLSGELVVARDLAHAEISARLKAGEPLPGYLRDHPVYYAGPAKTPNGMAAGSFGPTTAGRMDTYVEEFQAAGGSLVMLAKGNRSQTVANACRRHGGFYLGSVGGPAARLAQDCIKSVEVIDYEHLGMEAVWKIRVDNFPAFVVIDDQGNDFFAPRTPALLQIQTSNDQNL